MRDYFLFGTGALCTMLYYEGHAVFSVFVGMLVGIATARGRI